MPPATGFLVGVHVGAGASLSQSGVPDEAPVAGLKPLSLPLDEPAVVAKWSMKPSPAGLSGVSSLAAGEALGGGGLTRAAGGGLGGGGLTGAAVAAGDACGAAPSQSGVPDDAPVAAVKPLSLPLNEPAADAKWSMKPSPAGLSGVASAGAGLALGAAAALAGVGAA